MTPIHRIKCRACGGTGEEPIACRCAARHPWVRAEECICIGPECWTCDGRGVVPCEEPDCDVCHPEPEVAA